MRMLGVKINFDYNAEAKVFANLLRHRQGLYEAGVFYNCWEGHSQGVEKFEEASRAQVFPLDTGWRPNPEGKRSLAGKAFSAAKIHASLPKMLRIARDYNPDVIYSCQQKWDCFAATYLAEKLGKPQVIHLHSIIMPWLGKQPLERLKTCDHIVTVSEFIREKALAYGIPSERVTVIRNTMHTTPPPPAGQREAIRKALGLEEDSTVLGIVGRLVLGKGHADTVQAFSQVAGEFPKAHLVIVGGGPLQETLDKQIRESGYSERIHSLGMRSDVPELLTAFDLFVHPTLNDAAPLAVLEACAAGLPVVAYAEGGVCEFVAQGENGLLTPVEDSVALVASLRQLLANPQERRRMGEASRQRIETEFLPEDWGRNLANVFQKLTATPATLGSRN